MDLSLVQPSSLQRSHPRRLIKNKNIANLLEDCASSEALLVVDEVGARKIPRDGKLAIAVRGCAGITISVERGRLLLDARMSACDRIAVRSSKRFQSDAEKVPLVNKSAS